MLPDTGAFEKAFKILDIKGPCPLKPTNDSIERTRWKVEMIVKSNELIKAILKFNEESEIQSDLEAAVKPTRYAGVDA